MRTNSVLAATAVASTLFLGACGTVHATGTTASGSEPLLRIGSGSAAVPGAAGFAARSIPGAYQVDGSLPSGPSHASTYRPGSASRSTVEHLAAALGASGAPVRHRRGWVVTGAAGTLRVADTGQWAYQSASEPCPQFFVEVDSSNGSVGFACAVPGIVVGPGVVAPGVPVPGSTPRPPKLPTVGAGTTPRPPALPAVSASSTPRSPSLESVAQLRAVADPLLSALGLDPGAALVTPADSTVRLDPVVAGLPTSGYETDVVVEGHQVLAAGGWVSTGAPTAAHTYPLLAAAAALRQLASMPRPMMGAAAIACPEQAPSPGALRAICGGPLVITGGRLGLSLQWDGGWAGTPVLVPAWFFSLRDDSSPLVLIAVDPKYLAQPAPPTTGSNPATGASTSPGSTGAGGAGTSSGSGSTEGSAGVNPAPPAGPMTPPAVPQP